MVTLRRSLNISLSIVLKFNMAFQNNSSKSWELSREISVVEFLYSETNVFSLLHNDLLMILKPMLWWWYSAWTPLFGLNLGRHLSTYPQLDHLGFEIYLIWLDLKLWYYLRFLWNIFLWLCCNLYLCWIGKVRGHCLSTFWGFWSPNGLTERHVLRCPPRINPKRGSKVHIITWSLDFSFLTPYFG